MITFLPWIIISILIVGVLGLAFAGSDDSNRTIPKPRSEDLEIERRNNGSC